MKMSTPERKRALFDTNAYTLLQNETFLTSGCTKIDYLLRGGFSKKGITQIYGQGGTGKTQLALQLCLTVQIPTMNKLESSGAIYVCTEDVFPSKRLHELLKKSHVAKKHSVSGDLIFVEHVSVVEQLEECICQKIPCLLRCRNIGLLVIDSIAAPFRVEYDEKDLKTRAKIFRKIGEQLHSISREHNITIICINQVSAMMSKDLMNTNNEQPILGIIWANQISHSVHLYKKDDRRFMQIMHSSCLPRKTVEYEIRDTGLVSL